MIYATYGCCFYALAYHVDDDDDGRKTNDDESLTQHMADVATHALVAKRLIGNLGNLTFSTSNMAMVRMVGNIRASGIKIMMVMVL